jgi:hypothetical protein
LLSWFGYAWQPLAQQFLRASRRLEKNGLKKTLPKKIKGDIINTAIMKKHITVNYF